MSYSPMAFNTATAGRAGFVRLGSGIGGQSDGTIVSNATLLGLTASSVGLGNVTNESKSTMFTNPTFTGTVSGVTASHVGLGNVTNESKATMFTAPTFTTSGAQRISFSGTATLATGNAFNFGTNAYSALVETGNNDIALVHGAYHVKGTLNNWIGATPAFNATAFVMGVEQQVGGKKFVFKSAPDTTGSAVTWDDVFYISTADDAYFSGDVYSGGTELVKTPTWTSWTPSATGLGLGSVTSAFYTRIGNIVHFEIKFTADSNSAGNFGSFPVAAAGVATGTWVYRNTSNPWPQGSGTWLMNVGSNAYFTTLTASSMGPGEFFIMTGTYRV